MVKHIMMDTVITTTMGIMDTTLTLDHHYMIQALIGKWVYFL